MNNNDPLSRRKWLGLATTATVGSTFLGTTAFAGPNSNFSGPTSKQSKDLGARVYNIRDFGAKGDGNTLDTASVQAAIDACHKDQGGTVLVPAGRFVIGTVELKSNIILHIAAQGVLLGTVDGKQYHAADAIPLSGDSTLNDGNVGLLYAVGAENITIEGQGTIDGQGSFFRSPTKGVLPPAGIMGSHRPYHLLFYQCKNLTVRDIFLLKSAFHSIRVIQCDFVKMEGLHIHSRVIHNNDGFHFISSRYVHISNCDIQCQDDACALFGSCQFITVTNCSFSTRWSVFRFGGGTATDITVSNCLIYETYGCPIKMRCGPGSRFENISFSNIVMRDVTGPISLGLGPQRSTSEPTPSSPGILRNISFSGIHATVVKPVQLRDTEFTSNYNPGELFSCIVLNGMGEGFMENISFNDVHVQFPGGGTAEQGAVRDVPKIAGEYFQLGVLPSYGLYARNVKGLSLQNLRFSIASPDQRPAVIFDHVEDAAVNGLSVQGVVASESLLRFIESRDILLTAVRVLTPTSVFLRLEGAGCANIKVDGGDVSKAAEPLAFVAGARREAVRLLLLLLVFLLPFALSAQTVTSLSALQGAIDHAAPGAVIILADGVYTASQSITIDKKGTAAQPITIEAATVGGAEITGTSGFVLTAPARYIIIRGFKFTHAASQATMEAGTSFCRWTRNVFQTPGDGEDLLLNGDDHEVDHNTFQHKNAMGRFIAVRGKGSQIAQRLHIHHNYFFDQQPQKGNGAETLQFGLSGFSLSNSNSIVEYNVFEQCAGENELISVKASQLIIRYNTIRDCPAQFTLRHGNRSSVYGNYFINTPGLRIFGDDHVIFSNHFEHCNPAIMVGNGDGEVADGAKLTSHDRPDRVLIAFNTLVDNAVNVLQSGRVNGLGATDITIADNIIQGGGPAAKISGPYTGGVWSGNVLFNTNGAGDMPSTGYLTLDPRLVRNASGSWPVVACVLAATEVGVAAN